MMQEPDNYNVTVGARSYIIGPVNNIDLCPVRIGKYCSIARGLVILSGNHVIIEHPECVASWPFDILVGNKEWPEPKHRTPVVIGNDVWIGQNVTIKQGIKICDGAVIGACSVVTKDVEPYEIVAGNPAKHIRFRFDGHRVLYLLNLKWWDWPEEKILSNLDVLRDINKLMERFP